MTLLKDIKEVHEVINRYRRFSKLKPEIFVTRTWKDLLDFSEGKDPHGLISTIVPNLGKEKWEIVIESLKESYQNAKDSIKGSGTL